MPAPIVHTPIDGDLEALRREGLRVEQFVQVLSGTWGTLGAGCLVLAAVSALESQGRQFPAAVVLGVSAVAAIFGAFWLHALRPAGRIVASLFALACAIPAGMLVSMAGVHDPPIAFRVAMLFGTPIAAVLSLWIPRLSRVFREDYRQQIVPATPHLSSSVPVTAGMMLGVCIPVLFLTVVLG